MSNLNERVCSRCGSPLVEVSKTVRETGNPLYPVTVTQYRCTNDVCQKESDHKKAELLKQKQEREEKVKKNLENRKAAAEKK